MKSKKVETIGDHPIIIDINDGGHYGGAGVIILLLYRLNLLLKKELDI